MKHLLGLVCKECGRDYPVAAQHACEFCFGPLEVAYDYDSIAAEVTRESIAAGPQTLWRYESLLPAPPEERIDLGAGWTRLRQAPRLAAELGLKKLWLKDDAPNPTHSFKDRVVSVALSVARSFGYDTAACASTGNLANAVAAHAAASGMKSIVFIPAGLESGKVAATTVFGGTVIEVEGTYDDVNRLCSELAGRTNWAFVNVNVRTYYAEGSKSLAFEIAEQLGWRYPDAVVAPMASGSLLTKVVKGLRELHLTKLMDEEPHTKIYGTQAAGCSPITSAFEAGRDEIQPVKANTIAKSLGIGNPADGYYALKEVRATGGSMVTVPEEKVAEGMRLLARTEGVFTETAGGVAISGLEELVRNGAIAPDDETVVLVTGIGLKTLEALGDMPTTGRIRPSVEEVNKIVGGIG
ncbi:MAG: threonine synthase [Actinomycetota bacterium]|jgi:threonine synthase|nr:threonine synthase [Actinomycetota bacterium]